MDFHIYNFFCLILNAAFVPICSIVLFIFLCTTFGKSLGVRKLYVKSLIRIFKVAGRIVNGRSIDDDSKVQKPPEKKFREAEGKKFSDTDEEIELLDTIDPTEDHWVKGRRRRPYRRSLSEQIMSGREVSPCTLQKEFQLFDILDFIHSGMSAIIEDQVTQRFVAEQLKSWNLLTRTSQRFEFINNKLTFIWICGFFIRYFILLPGRICILLVGLLWLGLSMLLIGYLPDSRFKERLHLLAFTTSFQILGGAISAVITYHNPQNRPNKKGICVANHTSPIDVLVLACDNAYALIGQRHSGFIGLMQSLLHRAADNIWFERNEQSDRMTVTKRLKQHVEDFSKLPILIFPEGTCINNTSVMQFKKGTFEVGGTIFPVAIKYDPRFGDAFWNSSSNGMVSYLYLMMTSWAIVCDVWYLPPMIQAPEENAIAFANRVKAQIARKGGLVDLVWDGNLKRANVKKEWKDEQQQIFSRKIK